MNPVSPKFTFNIIEHVHAFSFQCTKKKYVPNSERNPEVLLVWHMLQLGGIRPMKIDSRESTKSMSDYLDWKKNGIGDNVTRYHLSEIFRSLQNC